jgi:uncharacterized protein (DUF488 family)
MTEAALELTTVGHGTLAAPDFTELVKGAGIATVVDVRSFPGSRRHPHFARQEMEQWLPAAGVGYHWEKDLGGFRKARPDSPNQALRHPSFRGYADYMATGAFSSALDRLMAEAGAEPVAVMCSESLWWRCHRRLLADAVVLWRGGSVSHLLHGGRRDTHRLTDGVRSGGADRPPVYDVGVTGRLV